MAFEVPRGAVPAGAEPGASAPSAVRPAMALVPVHGAETSGEIVNESSNGDQATNSPPDDIPPAPRGERPKLTRIK
jgi:hypothetical protein